MARAEGNRKDFMLKASAAISFVYGAIPTLLCLLASFFFGIALNLAMLPFTLLAAVWSLACGQASADRVEIRNDRAVAPMSRCEMTIRIIFMPFIVNLEELKLLTGQQ